MNSNIFANFLIKIIPKLKKITIQYEERNISFFLAILRIMVFAFQWIRYEQTICKEI